MSLIYRALTKCGTVSWRRLADRPFVRHVGVLTLANVATAVLSFGQGVLVARWLGPELYGVAALVMSVPSVVYTFFDARSAEASIKYLSEFDALGDRSRAAAMCWLGYGIDFAIAGVAFAAVLVLAPWAAAAIVHRPELAWLLVAYAVGFLPRAMEGTSLAVLTVHRRFATLAALKVGITVVRISTVVALLLAGLGVVGVVLANTAAMALSGMLHAAAAWPIMHASWGRVAWQDVWVLLKGRRREIFRFVAFNDLSGLLGLIPKQLDVVILGYFRGATEVGYYRLANRLASVVGYLVYPLQSVSYPELARTWGGGNSDGFRRRIRKYATRLGMPLGLATAGSGLLLPTVVPLLVGEAYLPAVLAAQVVLAGAAVWLAFFWLRPAYLAVGRLDAWSGISAVVTGLTLVAFLAAAPLGGYLAMSFCRFAAQLLFHGLAAWVLWNKGFASTVEKQPAEGG